MHSEWIGGVILRPLMDAGYTAWRDGERLGIARLVEDTIKVEADDPHVRELLHQRLAADARAAGIHLRIEASESPGASEPAHATPSSSPARAA